MCGLKEPAAPNTILTPPEPARVADQPPWHERFQSVTSGVQAIVLSAAVIVAGVWAVFTYVFVQQPLAEGQVRELQLKTALQGMLDLSVTARQLNDSRGRPLTDSAAELYAEVDVTIKNIGNKPVAFSLVEDNAGLIVARVDLRDSPVGVLESFFDEQRPTHRDPFGSNDTDIGIEAGGVERLSYVVHATEPGLYCAVFRAHVADSDVVLKNHPSPSWWRAKQYFVIEIRPPSRAKPPPLRPRRFRSGHHE